MMSRLNIVAVALASVMIMGCVNSLPTSNPDEIVPETSTPEFMKKLPVLELWSKPKKSLMSLWKPDAAHTTPELMSAAADAMAPFPTFLGVGSGAPTGSGHEEHHGHEDVCHDVCPARCMNACNDACQDGLNEACHTCAKENHCDACLQCHIDHMQGHEQHHEHPLEEQVCSEVKKGQTCPAGMSGVFFPGAGQQGSPAEGAHVTEGATAPVDGIFCDCSACVNAFKSKGGCEKWLAGDKAGIHAAIPAGCTLCGKEAAEECGIPAEITEANKHDGTDRTQKDTDAINAQEICTHVDAGAAVPASTTGVFFPDSGPPVTDGQYVSSGAVAPESGKFCDCSACVDAFAEQGGCEMWQAGRDPSVAIPPGCHECRAEAADRCGIHSSDEGCGACCQCPGFPDPTSTKECHGDQGCLDHCTDGNTCAAQCAANTGCSDAPAPAPQPEDENCQATKQDDGLTGLCLGDSDCTHPDNYCKQGVCNKATKQCWHGTAADHEANDQDQDPCQDVCPMKCMEACEADCEQGPNPQCYQCAKKVGCGDCLQCHMTHMASGSAQGAEPAQPVPTKGKGKSKGKLMFPTF